MKFGRTPSEPARHHRLANLFPMMEGAELDALREDILKNGVLVPVVFLGGEILDGRNRHKCALELGISYPRVDYEGDNPLGFVISTNLHRRHLTESQRAIVATRLAKLPKGANQYAQICAPSQSEAADMLKVSRRAVQNARKAEQRGVPELIAQVELGRIAVSTAADVAELSREDQAKIVKQGEKKILEAAKEIRTKRQKKARAKRDKLIIELSNFDAPLPTDRRYAIILADPPWKYDFSPSSGRAVENHYPTMSLEEILALPVSDLCTPDAMLFLWAPPAFHPKSLLVLEAWGFTYATHMVWDKDLMGTGIYFRQQHEILVLGKRGKPITPAPGAQARSVMRVRRTRHSAKPVETYGFIDKMYPGLPKIELFARDAVPDSWDKWGNQSQQ